MADKLLAVAREAQASEAARSHVDRLNKSVHKSEAKGVPLPGTPNRGTSARRAVPLARTVQAGLDPGSPTRRLRHSRNIGALLKSAQLLDVD